MEVLLKKLKVNKIEVNQITRGISKVYCMCACVLNCFTPVQLFAALWTVTHQAPLSWDSPGKNIGMGSHSLLQGIFLTQGSNPNQTREAHKLYYCLIKWKFLNICNKSIFNNFLVFSFKQYKLMFTFFILCMGQSINWWILSCMLNSIISRVIQKTEVSAYYFIRDMFWIFFILKASFQTKPSVWHFSLTVFLNLI